MSKMQDDEVATVLFAGCVSMGCVCLVIVIVFGFLIGLIALAGGAWRFFS